MELSRKALAGILLLCIVASVSVTTLALEPTVLFANPHKDPELEANVYILKETPEGTSQIDIGNINTDRAEMLARNIFGYDNITTWNKTQWISVGNSTISAANTKLDSEATSTGFTRAANDSITGWYTATDYGYNISKKFTATGNIWINATGLHFDSVSDSSNNLFALAYLGAMEDFQNNWNCTIIWVVTWNFN